MKRFWLIAVLALSLVTFTLCAQEPEPPKPAPEPAPPGDEPKPEPPKEEPKPDGGKVVVYVDVIDYTDGKKYKWRVTEFLIAKTFELANPENKEKWKEQQRKAHDWSKYSKAKREKKIEKDYHNQRKRKGVGKLDLSHIKVIQWRPKPKEKDKDKKDEGEDKKGEGEEKKGGDENGEEPEDKPEEKGDEPPKPPKGDEKPEKPAPKKKWVDPKETADYLILGEVKFKKGKKAKYFGNTVAWNSLGDLNIRVIRRVDRKVIKEYKEKLKRSHTLGQERAHHQCMQDMGQKVATEIVNLSVFRKKK